MRYTSIRVQDTHNIKNTYRKIIEGSCCSIQYSNVFAFYYVVNRQAYNVCVERHSTVIQVDRKYDIKEEEKQHAANTHKNGIKRGEVKTIVERTTKHEYLRHTGTKAWE